MATPNTPDTTRPSIVWFRDDLRLADNPALRAAVDRGAPVVAVFILDEESPGIRSLGAAAKWWLHHSLNQLASRLADRGARLILRRGPAADVIRSLADETDAGAVFWNRRYGGAERSVDQGIKERVRDAGADVASFAASVLFEPWTVTTGAGTPYAVFTPFWKACQALPAPRQPLPEPREIAGADLAIASDDLDEWMLLPTSPDWATGFTETGEPGELGARQRLAAFLDEDLGSYDSARDEPAAGSTSRLSAPLRWGEISPYTVWHETLAHAGTGRHAASAHRFLSEIGWREFAWHIAYHSPDLATKNIKREFDEFPWPPLDEDHLRAWQRGVTGVPLVDAGMRELWHTGTMHNRVRMVVASFLTKNLLIDWRLGEQWFWDTLIDADAASNPFNWQWVAGSGADAAPYFRVFNPELQAQKFDPHGEYIRSWAPEYTGAGDGLAPQPIVDLRETRQRALDAYDVVKRSR
ncbi:deoxyribodipyrimidine photo-lyase [Microbacterium sp. C7(2022)]|uniref:cryptochrome/photolyase family protein n=1 Tax=Microbacterium sp. C7(2022) TaxID=2992759 RepID=UPI00237A91DF|nr:deoxyribodipyrimidine photo-lyase [Microbacterium sp. C7(2022)]MDE0547599.1 DNA photolyase family protein [Microbacterium sp. C7(2022)]